MYDLNGDPEFGLLFRMAARRRLRSNPRHPTEDRDLTDTETKRLRALISSRHRADEVRDALADIAVDHPIADRDSKGEDGEAIYGGGILDWIKANWTTILKVLLTLLMFLGDEAGSEIKDMRAPPTEDEKTERAFKAAGKRAAKKNKPSP